MKMRPVSLLLQENVCRLWDAEPRLTLLEISVELGVSRQTVCKYLRIARKQGDSRALRRQEFPSRQMVVMLDVLENAHPETVPIEVIRDAFWPHGDLPANWRPVISVVASRVRAAYGADIVKGRNAFTLVGYADAEAA